MYGMTPWVQRILIANVAMFFVTASLPGLTRLLWFYPPTAFTQPWSVVTYMFLHGGFGHLFFNMFSLVIFGPRLEAKIGANAFLRLYFLSGIGAALFQTLFATAAPMVGASGAVYAVLVGFAYYYPHEQIMLLFPPIPMPAWVLAGGLVALSIFNGVTATSDGVAHFAHLGGAVVGFAFLRVWEWRRGASKRDFQRKMGTTTQSGSGFVGERVAVARWKGISIESLHELNREEVRRLLDKVKADGAGSLSQSERTFLDRMASQ
jgi:membrane associated rhomboid family serine protease